MSVERLTTTVTELASDRYTDRRVGTPGSRAAAEWLVAQLRGIGAEVEFEDFLVSGVRDLYGSPAMRWTDGDASRQLTHRRDFNPTSPPQS